MDKNKTILETYQTKVNELKISIIAKDKIFQKYENAMEKISKHQSKLEGIYSAMKSELQGFLPTENN